MTSSASQPATTDRLAALSGQKRALLASLRAERGRQAAGPAPVDELRAGTGVPTVLIHPVGGNVLSYVDLVARLPTGPPVVALPADHLLAGDAPASLPLLAAHYLARLAEAAVRPGVLVGWSFGGVVAYDMARQLAEQGTLCPVVLLDSMPTLPELVGQVRDETGIVQSFTHDLIRSAAGDATVLGLDPTDPLWQAPPEQALLTAERRLADRGFVVGLPEAELLRRYRVYRNAVRVLDTYPVPSHAGPVHLLHATIGDDDPPAVWGPAAPGLHVTRIDTDHYDLMRPPAVDVAAALIDAARH
jgi:thioesterase domain-containing protein